MTFHQAVFAHLTTTPAVASLVGTRVFPQLIPERSFQDATRYGCLVYQRTNVERLQRLCETDGLVRGTLQLDAYARRATGAGSADAIASAARASLVDFRGELGGAGGLRVKIITLEDEVELMDPEPGLFRVSQSYSVWYVET